MSLLKVAHFDKCLIDRLGIARTLDDPEGDSYVHLLVQESLKNNAIGAAAKAQSLSVSELAFAYKTVVRELYPNVFIFHGGPLLVASLPFIDEENFPYFAALISSGISPSDSHEIRTKAIAENMTMFCEQLWNQAKFSGNARDKNWAFERAMGRSATGKSSGCFGVLAVGLFVSCAILCAAFVAV